MKQMVVAAAVCSFVALGCFAPPDESRQSLIVEAGERSFMILTSEPTSGGTPIGFAHEPEEGAEIWLYEGVVPTPPEVEGQSEWFTGLASHPQRDDTVYVLAVRRFIGQDIWQQVVYRYNLTTGERDQLWTSTYQDIVPQISDNIGLGTDCDGQVWGTTFNVGTGYYDIWRLHPQTSEHTIVDSQPVFPIDLIGDLRGNMWDGRLDIRRRYGPDAQTALGASGIASGLALDPSYIESAAIETFIYYDSSLGNGNGLRRIAADGPDTGEFVGRVFADDDEHSPVIMFDIATLPGWCPCGGGLPDTLAELNDQLDTLTRQKFFLEWDLANAGSVILFEDLGTEVLAHEHEYDCPDEQSVPGLQLCLANLNLDIADVEAQIDTVTEAYEEQGCEPGDL